ncbi:PREDICTED: carbohydrate sulfotransferase 11 isoform X1 [Nicrophorus vespilloides]|uniref:Carbohydrate sulfotransferase n=1 Tax=Nicrophorus vespilloides TaxID=110193 RepID=A0ABM1MJE4_NICVS|nr:PREDICTED: carbohydrate sulfotransferase 11 isoform X1 [Nicrophorus vespilloides]
MQLLTAILCILPIVSANSIPWLEQISRQETLTSGCARFSSTKNEGPLNVSSLNHILVDHRHKFLYCYVPKVACTNWKRVLMVLTGKSNATDLVGISASLAHSDGALEKLTDLPSEEALSVLNNYTSFMMVRHPFERLLSAYRNKLEDDKASARYFQGIFGRHIIKNYRKDPKAEDIRTGANVTFKEFVQYLIAEGVDDDTANEHWRSMDRLCRPCQLNYTFIGKYDTFAEDAEVVLGMIKAPKLIFPQTRSGRTAERIRLYYQKLSLEEIEMLYKIYRKDFKYFGYGLDNVLGYDIG